jgi:Tfp pilus assembly protein PilF
MNDYQIEGYNNLAFCYQKTGQNDKTLEYFRKLNFLRAIL